MTQAYFMGGKGIIDPVDCNGDLIQEGDVLTSQSYADYKFFEDFKSIYGNLTHDEINKKYDKPEYLVKKDEKGILYGDGLIPTYESFDMKKSWPKRFYLHDFCFKTTKRICHISENPKLYIEDEKCTE